MATNYYEILNVHKEASNKVICEAYKKMALKWHPDKNPDNKEEANQKFLEISQAYQVLSDSNKRFKYDQGKSMDYHDFEDDDDDDDDFIGPFFHFISPEMLFRHIFQQYEERAFGQYFDFPRNNSRNRNGNVQNERRNGNVRDERRNENVADSRRKKKDTENHHEESCHTRMVNGKQWMTKTYYEKGNRIVTRYEDGELISKQINGVSQTIKK